VPSLEVLHPGRLQQYTRQKQGVEKKKEERRRGEAAHREAGQRVSFDFDGVHPEGAHQFQDTVFFEPRTRLL
jgi:hypothetical protein